MAVLLYRIYIIKEYATKITECQTPETGMVEISEDFVYINKFKQKTFPRNFPERY
jgi:hypothetical protein